MNVDQLITLFRAEVKDEVAPYLWSDVEVYNFVDEAQKMFCRKTGGLADSQSAVTTIECSQGDIYVDISPVILKIVSARRASDNGIIEVVNLEDELFGPPTTDYGRITNAPLFSTVEGKIRKIVSNMDANQIRLIDIPEADEDILLSVYRLPLEPIVTKTAEEREEIGYEPQVFEINEMHHRYLMYWMKHLAHTKQDAETYDRGKSKEFQDAFFGYCALAKEERERREHKYRVMGYGGI
jgi:hypothetical protein